jgi:hypothetical protein
MIDQREKAIKALKALLAQIEGGRAVSRCDVSTSLGEPLAVTLAGPIFTTLCKIEIELANALPV